MTKKLIVLSAKNTGKLLMKRFTKFSGGKLKTCNDYLTSDRKYPERLSKATSQIKLEAYYLLACVDGLMSDLGALVVRCIQPGVLEGCSIYNL